MKRLRKAMITKQLSTQENYDDIKSELQVSIDKNIINETLKNGLIELVNFIKDEYYDDANYVINITPFSKNFGIGYEVFARLWYGNHTMKSYENDYSMDMGGKIYFSDKPNDNSIELKSFFVINTDNGHKSRIYDKAAETCRNVEDIMVSTIKNVEFK